MSTLTAPPRSVGVPGRALATHVALVAGRGVAFVVAPPWLAATGPADPTNESQLVAAFRAGVIGYWRSGDSTYPPDLRLERLDLTLKDGDPWVAATGGARLRAHSK